MLQICSILKTSKMKCICMNSAGKKLIWEKVTLKIQLSRFTSRCCVNGAHTEFELSIDYNFGANTNWLMHGPHNKRP